MEIVAVLVVAIISLAMVQLTVALVKTIDQRPFWVSLFIAVMIVFIYLCCCVYPMVLLFTRRV